jgi:hypothetical protein
MRKLLVTFPNFFSSWGASFEIIIWAQNEEILEIQKAVFEVIISQIVCDLVEDAK